ncbi:hypothetical protein [Roseomonas alba]|nr:hypothetical protein [Neoroseomonas alba]
MTISIFEVWAAMALVVALLWLLLRGLGNVLMWWAGDDDHD